MNTLPDVRGTRPGADRVTGAAAHQNVQTPTAIPVAAGEVAVPLRRLDTLRSRLAPAVEWASGLDVRWQYPLLIFVLTRVLYMAIMVVDHYVRSGSNGLPWSFGHELSNWDGRWYVATATFGYAHHVLLTNWNTLGFLPLYPMLMWAISNGFGVSDVLAGMIVSTITGAIATVLLSQLADRWWGANGARKAILFFCLFPGSIVFSMVYTEGLLLALIAGCLLAMEQRRWVIAGLLAGLSTAVEPVAMGIIPACAAAAFMEIRRRGWHDRAAWKSLAAPVLAPAGALAFAIFLWFWTGTPLASYQTQKVDWHETTTPLAVPRALITVIKQALGTEGPPHPNVDLNLIIGVLGTIFLAWGLIHMWRIRNRISLAAWVWTGAIVFMTLTSNSTPPNARMLICAFPVLLTLGAELRGRAYTRLLGASTLMLIVMSMITFVSNGLRP